MFSVVIPVGRSEHITKCLTHLYAAIAAYGKNMDVFIVDTKDDPEVATLVNDFVIKNKVTNLHLEVWSGVSPHHARWIGLYNAEGSYVHFLDDDDYVVPSFYIEAERAHQSCEVALGKGAIYVGNWTRRIDGYSELESINTSSMTFSKSAADQIFTEIPKSITCHAEDMLYVLVANRMLHLSIGTSAATLKRGVYRDGYREVERYIGAENYKYWSDVLEQPINDTTSPILDEWLLMQHECFKRWILVDVVPHSRNSHA